MLTIHSGLHCLGKYPLRGFQSITTGKTLRFRVGVCVCVCVWGGGGGGSENDQLTGHFQSLFSNWSFSELFLISREKKNSKTYK